MIAAIALPPYCYDAAIAGCAHIKDDAPRMSCVPRGER